MARNFSLVGKGEDEMTTMATTNKIKLTKEQRRILFNVKERGYPNDGSATFTFLQEKGLVKVHQLPRAGWFVTELGELALQREPGELVASTESALMAVRKQQPSYARDCAIELLEILVERIEALEAHASSPHCRGCSCSCGVYPCVCGRCK